MNFLKIYLEKNLCFLYDIIYLEYWKEEIQLDKFYIKLNEKCEKNLKHVNLIQTQTYCYVPRCYVYQNYFYFYYYKHLLAVKKNSVHKNLIYFANLNTQKLLFEKRRKRRKFSNDEERRIARILKNRRTAEESRQRKIQKMKELENFVLFLEGEERKKKKELLFLGKISAFQTARHFFLKKNLFIFN